MDRERIAEIYTELQTVTVELADDPSNQPLGYISGKIAEVQRKRELVLGRYLEVEKAWGRLESDLITYSARLDDLVLTWMMSDIVKTLPRMARPELKQLGGRRVSEELMQLESETTGTGLDFDLQRRIVELKALREDLRSLKSLCEERTKVLKSEDSAIRLQQAARQTDLELSGKIGSAPPPTESAVSSVPISKPAEPDHIAKAAQNAFSNILDED